MKFREKFEIVPQSLRIPVRILVGKPLNVIVMCQISLFVYQNRLT